MTDSGFLSRIIQHKRREIDINARRISEKDLRGHAELARVRRPFFEIMARPGPFGLNIIAEVKRASPSKGVIRTNLDAHRLAQTYETGGAAAISVLTDAAFFKAKPDDLKKARAAVSLPVMRKDFIISTYQIYESAVMGADAILLIVRAVSKSFLQEALALCGELSMEALVEVHSAKELETATSAGARLFGINNRNLSTFETDIQNSLDISRYLTAGQIAVSESGIRKRGDVETLRQAGIHNFLIGESLVKTNDPEKLLRELMGRNEL